jgi:hypothetical protein
LHLKKVVISWDSTVSTVTGPGLDGQRLIPGKGRDFSLLCSVQTGSGAHLVYHVMGTGHEADYSSPSNAKVKNGGAIPLLLHTFHDILNYAQRKLYFFTFK